MLYSLIYLHGLRGPTFLQATIRPLRALRSVELGDGRDVRFELLGSFPLRRTLRRRLLRNTLALGPWGLEYEGLLLCLAGRALLHAPASFSFHSRSGGASRVALTGLSFNSRLGGVTGPAPADLLGVIGLSGCFGTALAGVTLLFPSLLCCPGPSSQGLP